MWILCISLYCSTHEVFFVFSCCLVMAPSDVNSSASILMSLLIGDWRLSCNWSRLLLSHDVSWLAWSVKLLLSPMGLMTIFYCSDWLQCQSYVMTDSQSTSLSWCWAPCGAQHQIFVAVRQLRVCWCGVPSLTRERGLAFIIAADPCHCSHSWVRVPWDSWPYFTVSDSRLPQPGGLGPHIYIP